MRLAPERFAKDPCGRRPAAIKKRGEERKEKRAGRVGAS
jgi:hypothetical protein